MRSHTLSIRAMLLACLALGAICPTPASLAQGNKIRLPVRVHIMTDLIMIHAPTALAGGSSGEAIARATMTPWLRATDVPAVFQEVNLIWKQANVEFYVESIVEHRNQGSVEDISYVILAKRTPDSNGKNRSDPNRIPRIYNCFDSSKHHPVIQNVYFFNFTGNTSQGYAGIPGRPGSPYLESNYVVVGIWTNKSNNGGPPIRGEITERQPAPNAGVAAALKLAPPQGQNYFRKGSIGRTVAHELGHNLELPHGQDRTNYGRLMGGVSGHGYRLTPDEVNKARSAAAVRARQAG